MEDIALGVKVFHRSDKLAALLESAAEHPITTVYVADDGHTGEREDLYDRDFPFDLEVLELEYDAGLGAGRAAIVDALDEEYILMTDSDHVLLAVAPLYEALSARDSCGGVAGLMYKEDGEVQANCHDLYEAADGDVLVRDIRGEKPIESAGPHPYVPFDYVPNSALYRRECLVDYCWDPAYVIGKDHLDFYLGHHRRTDWTFGILPQVTMLHDPGGDSAYLTDRLDSRKTWASKRYFLNKWGYDQIVTRRHWSGISDDESGLGEMAGGFANRTGIGGVGVGLQRRLLDLHDLGMRGKAWWSDQMQ